MDEPDDDLFATDDDLIETTEPKVWLVTIYPDEGNVTDVDVENALLVLPEVQRVELKRMS